ncbi:MAG: phosphoglycerate dehydrogenase [bacterium]|nr:phosphoglycerate dehydrogenase [bacterium]
MPDPVRVLIADAVSDEGIELLRSTPGFEVDVKTGMKPAELQQVIGDYDALVVRSATKVTADTLAEPGRMRAIGRAGTGVDNIDLDAATKAGVVVMNTPGGNSVAAAELTMAHLLALSRNVSQANSELREGRWERKKYMGVEVSGKTLGIVGLGRIGREVARTARGLRMEVVGYDPFVSADMARDYGIEAMSLEEVVERADFLTLHLPRTDETRHIIDAAMLDRMKPGVRLINCARGGLIDEAALLEALEAGKIAGAALDVFESEPPADLRLVQHPHVVATPHLGASTREAQVRVGTEIAEKIRDYLQNGVILDAVNFPSMGRDDSAVLVPVMQLAERLGSFLAQIAEGGFKRLEIRTVGTLAEHTLKPVVMAAAKGLLTPVVTTGGVSYVNALALAAERGVTVDESRSSEGSPYAGLLRLTLETDAGTTTVAGTLVTADRPRLVEVDGVSIESRCAGEMVFFRNRDVPGVVGTMGTILGDAGVNIAGIRLGRPRGEEVAVSIINVDSKVPAEVLDRICAIDDVVFARSVSV